MESSSKDSKSIKFVAEFLSTVVHVPVTPDLIITAAENKGDQSSVWYILIDLSLIHTSGYPDTPKNMLNKFWQVLSAEGQEHVPIEGEHSVCPPAA